MRNSIKNAKSLTLKIKVKVKEVKNGSFAIRLEMFDSIIGEFSKFQLPSNIYLRKEIYTHTYPHTARGRSDDYRLNMHSRFA